MEILIMSNGRGKRWLVITNRSGEWIFWQALTPAKSGELRALGIAYHVDIGMTDPGALR